MSSPVPASSSSPAVPPTPRARSTLVAGALAAGVALLVLLVARVLSPAPGMLEVIADGVTRYIPLDLFELGISLFGPLAKGLVFGGVAAGVVAVGALAGAGFVRAGFASGSPAASVLLVAGSLLLLAELVALPVFGAGPLGLELAGEPVALHAPLALACLAYGAMLVAIVRGVEPAVAAMPGATASEVVPAGLTLRRRTFLGRTVVLLGLGSLSASALTVAIRVIEAARAGPSLAARRRPMAPGGFGPTPAVTPVSDFYVIQKNVIPTVVDVPTWRLAVSGLVDRPRRYTLDELRAMPAVEGYRTLQCISNFVVRYGPLIGNQRWAGVRCRDVLDAAGVQPAATHVHWLSADGYVESLPIEVARDERTWLVHAMGEAGEPLTPEHGAPLRVLIADRYGMKQPKWLTEIVVAAEDRAGYWQERGWDKEAFVRTYSRIDEPLQADVVPAAEPFTVYGIASAGDRGIDRVEVSADDGASWRDTELEAAVRGDDGPISDLTWVRWRIDMLVPRPGVAHLLARATDGTGMVQDPEPRPPLPSGATGLHRVEVIAVERSPSPAPTQPA